jgi:hypothetical protein
MAERLAGAASGDRVGVECGSVFELHRVGWDWFSLLARQRIQLVSFWFVAMSFLTTAGMTAYTRGFSVAAMGISLAMAGASVVFYLLDVRTQGQLASARKFLEDVEREIAARAHLPSAEIAVKLHAQRRGHVPYRYLFAWLYGGASLLSAAALVAMWLGLT